jgi:predicted GH43/DUF377 family glycosyl hydrolase
MLFLQRIRYMEKDTVSHSLYPPIIEVKKLIGKCCFNGSLFAKCLIKGSSKPVYTNFISKDVVSCRIFFVYRSTPSVSEGFKSSIHMTRVSLKTGRADISTNVTLFKDLQYEDPRVFCYNDKVFVTFSNVINRIPIHIEINGIYLDEHLNMIRSDDENSISLVSFPINKLARTQKNWTFFKELDVMHIIYNIMPFEVYLWDEDNGYIPLLSRSWQHPTNSALRLRGGAPPIKVDGVYYAFVHSTDYEVYCITFHPSTFQVIQVSSEPILKNRGKKKDIHFPCGALWNAFESKFYVSLGVDDVKLCFFSIDKKLLDEQLINVEESPTEKELVTCFDENFVWINSWGGGSDFSLVSFLKSRNVPCRNAVWDQVGCHFPYYIRAPARKIYLVQQPLISIARMIMSRTQRCNLLKLADTINAQFSLTSLIYFMSKQFEEWVECKRDDVLVTKYGSSEVDLDLVCEWLDIELTDVEHDTAFIKGSKASISDIDLERLRHLLSQEGKIGVALLERLEFKLLQRFPDCL